MLDATTKVPLRAAGELLRGGVKKFDDPFTDTFCGKFG